MDKIQYAKDVLIEELNCYSGLTVKEFLSKIKYDIQNILNNKILSEHPYYEEDFPIEFENYLGKWKICADGQTLFQPKVEVEYIEVSITIPSNATLQEDK